MFVYVGDVTVMWWSLNEQGSLNDSTVQPPQLQDSFGYVSGGMPYVLGGSCWLLLKKSHFYIEIQFIYLENQVMSK